MRGDRRFPEADERLNLQSLGRALDVLEIYSVDPTPKSLGEIARLAGITKSAAQRVAQSLLSRGYLEHSAQGGLAPGRILLERAFDYLRTNPLIERAAPILTDLRKMSGERVDLSLFDARHDNLAIVYALLEHEGLCLGLSSGINVAGAIRLARQLGPGKTIVTILADYGTRYHSRLFNPDFLRSKNLPVPAWLERKTATAPDFA